MKLTAKQREAQLVINGSAKHCLLDGGSRSGKSALFVRNICVRAIKAPKSRHAILRFRFNHCKESIGLDTLPKVMEQCFPDVPYSLNKSDWYVQLPNQAEIWLGGLDDKERTEKILGKEYATIYLNECSQIGYAARNLAVTRLAQQCPYELEGEQRRLGLKMYYDCNPPSRSHWIYQLFYQWRDPETKRPIVDAENFARMTMNPRDNAENLPADYISELERLPARMRKRFLDGVYADSSPGALWTEEIIERYRVSDGEVPDLQRIVVSVDPSGSGEEDNAGNDDIGIIVGGIGTDGVGYVLEDLTLKGGPEKWGGVAVSAFDRHDADLIIGETNFGGDMVRFVVQSAATKPGRNARQPSFKKLTASRGKVVRAEPISALHETGKIRLVGHFPELEDELCAMTTNGYAGSGSPNRADAFVWLMSELFPGMVKAEKVEKKARVRERSYEPHGWLAS